MSFKSLFILITLLSFNANARLSCDSLFNPEPKSFKTKFISWYETQTWLGKKSLEKKIKKQKIKEQEQVFDSLQSFANGISFDSLAIQQAPLARNIEIPKDRLIFKKSLELLKSQPRFSNIEVNSALVMLSNRVEFRMDQHLQMLEKDYQKVLFLTAFIRYQTPRRVSGHKHQYELALDKALQVKNDNWFLIEHFIEHYALIKLSEVNTPDALRGIALRMYEYDSISDIAYSLLKTKINTFPEEVKSALHNVKIKLQDERFLLHQQRRQNPTGPRLTDGNGRIFDFATPKLERINQTLINLNLLLR